MNKSSKDKQILTLKDDQKQPQGNYGSSSSLSERSGSGKRRVKTLTQNGNAATPTNLKLKDIVFLNAGANPSPSPMIGVGLRKHMFDKNALQNLRKVSNHSSFSYDDGGESEDDQHVANSYVSEKSQQVSISQSNARNSRVPSIEQSIQSRKIKQAMSDSNLNGSQRIRVPSIQGPYTNQRSSLYIRPNAQQITNVNPAIVWKKGWPMIAYYVTRAVSRFKKAIFFNRPEMINRTQITAIDDKSIDPSEWEDVSNQYSSWIYRTSGNIRRLLLSLIKNFQTLKRCLEENSLSKKYYMYINYLFPVLKPFGGFQTTWSILIFTITVMLYVYLPFLYCFYEIEDYFNDTNKLLIGTLAIIFLAMDMLRKANTSYFWRGSIVIERKQILMEYITKTFCFDLMTLLSLTIMVNQRYPGMYLIFMCRFLYTDSMADRLRESFLLQEKIRAMVDFFVLLAKVLFACHILASIWHLVGLQGLQQDTGWILGSNLQFSPLRKRYVYSFYTAAAMMSTVGNDIRPETELEIMLTIIMMFFASALFGYTISTIGNIFNELKRKREEYLHQLAQINSYMSNRVVNPYHQSRARKYIEYINTQGANRVKTAEHNLKSLSQYLREEIKEDVFSKSIEKLTFLRKNFSDQFLRQLCQCVKEQVFAPDEIILKNQFTEDPCIYVITKGEVELFTEKSQLIGTAIHQKEQRKTSFNTVSFSENSDVTIVKLLSQDMIFGHLEFFMQQGTPTLCARSLGVTEVDIIKLSDFKQLLENYPEELESFAHIRDSITLYQDFSRIEIQCYSCQESGHTFTSCPRLFYDQNKQRIIRYHQENINKQIATFKRQSKRKYFRSRLELEEIFTRADQFFDDNMDHMVNDESDDIEVDDEQILELAQMLQEELKPKETRNFKRHTTIRCSMRNNMLRRLASIGKDNGSKNNFDDVNEFSSNNLEINTEKQSAYQNLLLPVANNNGLVNSTTGNGNGASQSTISENFITNPRKSSFNIEPSERSESPSKFSEEENCKDDADPQEEKQLNVRKAANTALSRSNSVNSQRRNSQQKRTLGTQSSQFTNNLQNEDDKSQGGGGLKSFDDNISSVHSPNFPTQQRKQSNAALSVTQNNSSINKELLSNGSSEHNGLFQGTTHSPTGFGLTNVQIDGNDGAVTTLDRESIEVEFNRVQMFTQYFPHNNIDIILSEVNQPNIWKKILRLKKLDTFRRGSHRRRSRRKLPGVDESHIQALIRTNTIRKSQRAVTPPHQDGNFSPPHMFDKLDKFDKSPQLFPESPDKLILNKQEK